MSRGGTRLDPDEVVSRPKPQIALAQIEAALRAGVPPGVVLADAGDGKGTQFRTDLTQLGLQYAVGIESNVTVWESGQQPLPAPAAEVQFARPSPEAVDLWSARVTPDPASATPTACSLITSCAVSRPTPARTAAMSTAVVARNGRYRSSSPAIKAG